jgi:hypothetical protein
MNTKRLTQIGASGILAVGLLAGTRPAPDNSAAFSGVLSGVVRTAVSGDARFGKVRGDASSPDVFTITLGADSPGGAGAVLFTFPRDSGLHVGSYHVAEVGAPDAELHGLVLVGSAYAPSGVFRATSGTLTVTSVSDSEVTGDFYVDAVGFLASNPDQDYRTVSATGSFIARRGN